MYIIHARTLKCVGKVLPPLAAASASCGMCKEIAGHKKGYWKKLHLNKHIQALPAA